MKLMSRTAALVLMGFSSAACAQKLPENAPVTNIVNVPATANQGNLPASASPFSMETLGQFEAPFAMAFLPDGSLLVTEKAGTIKLRQANGTVVKVSGAPAVAAGGQGGLLGIRPAPDYARSHIIYFAYSEGVDSDHSQLALARARLTVRPDSDAALEGPQVIWRYGSVGPGGQFGAKIAFAPDQKSLFLSSGERQRFTPAQDPDQRLGKIIHLTLDGKAWPGNPEYKAGGARADTWSTGHRNPYGLVFVGNTLWECEMGPKGGDEINLILPGRNYGWPIVSNGDNYSGQPIPDHPSRPDLEAPKIWWNPSISPGGLAYYDGAMFPQYRGSLLVAALSGKALIRVAIQGSNARTVEQWDMGTRIRDVAQAPDGSIWLLEDASRRGGGRLLRLTPEKAQGSTR